MTDAPARLETGVLQDGDDWPGVFIRGDNALMGYAPALAAVLCGRATSLHENMVGRLLDLLQRCGDRETDKQVIRRAATLPAPVVIADMPLPEFVGTNAAGGDHALTFMAGAMAMRGQILSALTASPAPVEALDDNLTQLLQEAHHDGRDVLLSPKDVSAILSALTASPALTALVEALSWIATYANASSEQDPEEPREEAECVAAFKVIEGKARAALAAYEGERKDG